MDFTSGSVVKNLPANAGDLGSIPGLGRFPGEGRGYPLQYSGLENSRDYTVYGVAKSRTWLSNFHFHFHLYFLDCPVHLTPTHINFVKLYIMKIFAREKNIINPQVPIFQLQQWRHLQSLLRKLSKKTSPACSPLTAGSGNVCASELMRASHAATKTMSKSMQMGCGASSSLFIPFCLPPQCHNRAQQAFVDATRMLSSCPMPIPDQSCSVIKKMLT